MRCWSKRVRQFADIRVWAAAILILLGLSQSAFARTANESTAEAAAATAGKCSDGPVINYLLDVGVNDLYPVIRAAQICVTAVIDKSPQFAQWSPAQAKAWCDAHHNAPCPLPAYSNNK